MVGQVNENEVRYRFLTKGKSYLTLNKVQELGAKKRETSGEPKGTYIFSRDSDLTSTNVSLSVSLSVINM